MPDFTNCKRLLGNAYNGANGKKIAIKHQGEQYMICPAYERVMTQNQAQDFATQEHEMTFGTM